MTPMLPSIVAALVVLAFTALAVGLSLHGTQPQGTDRDDTPDFADGPNLAWVRELRRRVPPARPRTTR